MYRHDLGKEYYSKLNESRLLYVREELAVINEKYDMGVTFHKCFFDFYFLDLSRNVGNVLKTMNFVEYVLKCKGYNDEEIKRFIIRNYRVLLSVNEMLKEYYDEMMSDLSESRKKTMFRKILKGGAKHE